MSIKECFMPRPGYLFLEADYRQLEIAGLAILSEDINLIKAINDDVDLHRKMASEWLKKDEASVTDEERRAAKAITFQLQYGAGYKSIARQHKISETAAKQFINSYYTLYPGVKRFHELLLLEAASFPEYKNAKKYGIISSNTGRYWMIPELMDDNGRAYFPPTRVKNYPIQGFSGGDIVLAMLGVLTEELVLNEQNNIHIVNTVHDSFLFEIPEIDLNKALSKIDEILSDTSNIISEIYNINIPVKIRVEYKLGRNWGDMRKLLKHEDGYFIERTD